MSRNARTIQEIRALAQICHEANRAYCLLLGDRSQLAWDNAAEWQQDSAINGVMMILRNPNHRPEDSHNGWLQEKEQGGWKYGPVKDAEKKEHPCMLPYAQLPEDQRRKDYLFLAVVRALTQEID